jgi:hypothetical protein
MLEPFENPTIVWRHWRHLPLIKAWQACALSLGIDPHSMENAWDRWKSGPGLRGLDADRRLRDYRREYERRLEQAGAHVRAKTFDLQGRLYDHDWNAEISIIEFVAWAREVEYEPLPAELDSIAAYRASKLQPDPVAAAKLDYPTSEAWQQALPDEARTRGLDSYEYQWPLWQEGLRMLDQQPALKTEVLARQLETIAAERGFTNRSGDTLNWATIKRHVLTGIQDAHARARRPKL